MLKTFSWDVQAAARLGGACAGSPGQGGAQGSRCCPQASIAADLETGQEHGAGLAESGLAAGAPACTPMCPVPLGTALKYHSPWEAGFENEACR